MQWEHTRKLHKNVGLANLFYFCLFLFDDIPFPRNDVKFVRNQKNFIISLWRYLYLSNVLPFNRQPDWVYNIEFWNNNFDGAQFHKRTTEITAVTGKLQSWRNYSVNSPWNVKKHAFEILLTTLTDQKVSDYFICFRYEINATGLRCGFEI